MSKLPNKFGSNLIWFLNELANSEAEQFETGEMEIIGENEQGQEGSTLVDVMELSEAAANRIKFLELERKELIDRAAIACTYSNLVHNQVVANQSAVIDSILSDSSEQGMTWIRNGLFGPGHLNEVQVQLDKKTPAQEYFNENEIPIKSHAMYKADVEEWLSEKVGK